MREGVCLCVCVCVCFVCDISCVCVCVWAFVFVRAFAACTQLLVHAHSLLSVVSVHSDSVLWCLQYTAERTSRINEKRALGNAWRSHI